MKIFKTFSAGFPVIIFLASIGCSDSLTPGNYAGKFIVRYDSATLSGETTLRISDGQYTSDGNDNRIPAGGSGTYMLAGEKIIFRDENMWTADFDWNMILNGEYKYSLRGKQLELTRATNRTSYRYVLTRRKEK